MSVGMLHGHIAHSAQLKSDFSQLLNRGEKIQRRYSAGQPITRPGASVKFPLFATGKTLLRERGELKQAGKKFKF